MANNLTEIVLGSGDFYLTAFSGTIPEDTTIETDANLAGRIKSGASLEYKPTEYEVFDDSRAVHKRFIVSEETTFKSGVLTWNLETLNKLTADGTYTDAAGERELKIGGKGARLMTSYLVRFVHTKSDGNKFRITLVGTASNGFTLSFAPDKETAIDAEIKAVSHDSDGTQIIITEEYSTTP